MKRVCVALYVCVCVCVCVCFVLVRSMCVCETTFKYILKSYIIENRIIQYYRDYIFYRNTHFPPILNLYKSQISKFTNLRFP